MHIRDTKKFIAFFLLAFLFYRTSISIVDLDLWHEMATAQAMVENRDTSNDLTFSYTPTLKQIIHHEWLTGLIVLNLVQILGSSALTGLKYILIFLIAFFSWKNATRNSTSVSAVFVTLILAICISDYGFGTIRAQMFTYLYCTLLIYSIDLDRQGKRLPLVALSLSFPFWINAHGGAFIGIIFMLGYMLELVFSSKKFHHLLLPLILSFFLMLLNPWGVDYYFYLAKALTMKRPFISEWLPIYKTKFSSRYLCLIYLFAIPLMYFKKITWRHRPGIILLLLTTFMSIQSVRFLPFLAITVCAYYPGIVDQTRFSNLVEKLLEQHRQKLIILLIVISIFLFYFGVRNSPLIPKVPAKKQENFDITYPVGAVDYLKAYDFKGNILCSYNDCSYVIWKLYPDAKVFIDGRYEVAYPDDRIIEDDVFFNKLQGWTVVLDKYPHDVILIRNNSKMVEELRTLPAWNAAYDDGVFTLFVKSDSRFSKFNEIQAPVEGKFP